MSEKAPFPADEPVIEPERYELREGPAYRFGLPRRDLFRAFGAGLLIVAAAPAVPSPADAATSPQQESGGGGARRQGGRGGGAPVPQEISAWLHIGEDGAVTVYTGKVEVGQNARTSLAQAVAEELRVPLASVRLVMGDTDLTPYDAGTFGSRTTPAMAPQLRRAAVAAREALLDLGAEQMKVARADLTAADGKVLHAASKQTRGYGELTRGQKLTKTVGAGDAAAPALTPPDQWKVAGKTALKVNARDIVTGKHAYTSDIRRPGMLYGRVLRPAAYGATLASLDGGAAEKLPGVVVVRDGDFAGVVAPGGSYQAGQALDALKAEWKTPAAPAPAAKDLFALLKQPPAAGAGGRGQDDTRGSIADGLAAAKQKFERSYTVAYIAHAPLEPRAAVAEWAADGKLTVWTGTQRPFGVRGELAQAFGIPEEKVRVIVPDTGSGYGGKHTGEAALEAARLAKAAGKPVKLVWTREEEFTWAYFRPAGVIDVTSGVAEDGTITAWEYHNYNSGSAAIRPVYDIANQRIVFHPAPSPLRQGSYRALAATANHFARETQIDEMARALKMDPLEFRLKNLKDERMRAVLQAAAEAFGWGKAKPAEGRGFGIAGGFDKGGYIANCVEVSVEAGNGAVRLRRIVTAFECGAIVNPGHLENQIEGGVIQGIGGALFEAIDFADGKISNPYFSMYRLPRFSDIPPLLQTVLLDRKDLPSAGAGESPLVALAPAIGSALFDASGVRLRSLPLAPRGVPKDAKA